MGACKVERYGLHMESRWVYVTIDSMLLHVILLNENITSKSRCYGPFSY